ncbi:MAG: hypothetical protein MJ225_04425 [Bacilli bacterium]|nr:hypothetical protein [Bacilli bacterium]
MTNEEVKQFIEWRKANPDIKIFGEITKEEYESMKQFCEGLKEIKRFLDETEVVQSDD